MHALATMTANKERQLTLLVLILSSSLVLSACGSTSSSTPNTQEIATAASQPPETTAMAVSTLTQTPTLTETPSATPTVTSTLGPSPTPAPTPIFGSVRVGNDFLFGNQPEGCRLPCWQGLVTGKSDVHDIQKAFEAAFGFSGMSDLPPESVFEDSGMPGLLVLPQQWTLQYRGEAGVDTFFVAAWVQRDTRILEAIRLNGEGSQFESYISLQRVMRELGTPSHILVSLGPTEAGVWANLELMIIYDEGIAIYYGVRILGVLEQAGGDEVAELCLGNMPEYPITNVFLTKSIEGNDIETLLSPLRYMGIDSKKIQSRFSTFQEAFGLSLEEVTKLAQERDNACVYAPAP